VNPTYEQDSLLVIPPKAGIQTRGMIGSVGFMKTLDSKMTNRHHLKSICDPDWAPASAGVTAFWPSRRCRVARVALRSTLVNPTYKKAPLPVIPAQAGIPTYEKLTYGH
jgi:hypothetical protein